MEMNSFICCGLRKRISYWCTAHFSKERERENIVLIREISSNRLAVVLVALPPNCNSGNPVVQWALPAGLPTLGGANLTLTGMGFGLFFLILLTLIQCLSAIDLGSDMILCT